MFTLQKDKQWGIFDLVWDFLWPYRPSNEVFAAWGVAPGQLKEERGFLEFEFVKWTAQKDEWPPLGS